MKQEQRKAAIREFKERKPQRGIYAVRCAATSQVWVGPSRDLTSARNSVWAGLRMGAHRDSKLQEHWNAHGEAAFAYEVLEKFDEELPVLLVPDLLKDRKQHWTKELAANGLL